MTEEQLEVQDIENHARFMERLQDKVTEHERELIDFAYDAAKYGHQDQSRDDGTRYFEHCRETALILMDELGIYDADMIIAALLHDMLEDNFLFTEWRLNHSFGPRAAEMIIAMTKPKKNDPRFMSNHERHEFYFQRLFDSDNDVIVLKLCDRLHNMRTLHHCLPKKRARKIQETESVYLPLAQKLLSASNDLKTQGYGTLLLFLIAISCHQAILRED